VVVFRINVICVGFVLVLLAPTTSMIASWYPGKKDILWLCPVGVLGICSFLWFLMRLSIPALIRWGIFEDRRERPRDQDLSGFVRVWRISFPMLVLIIQISILIFMCMCVLGFLRSDTLVGIIQNIPFKQRNFWVGTF